MSEWDTNFNVHLSMNDMINFISNGKLSLQAKGSIWKKLIDQNRRIKSSDQTQTEYLILIENLTEEWCIEENMEKCNRLFKMIRAYEEEYELLLNLKKVIRDKLAEYSSKKKLELQSSIDISSE